MKKPLTYLLVFCFPFVFTNFLFGENLEVQREYWKKYILWGTGNLKKETLYKNGKKEGPTKYWYKSGKIKGERHFKNGKEDGLLKWWYESGKKMAIEHYKDGEKDGLATWWYENGKKMKDEHYKVGIKNGRWIAWYENGNKRFEINRKISPKSGLPMLHGPTIFWDKEGKKTSEKMYIDDVEK